MKSYKKLTSKGLTQEQFEAMLAEELIKEVSKAICENRTLEAHIKEIRDEVNEISTVEILSRYA